MKEQEQISEMFNAISGKYDRINRILSMGIDKRWRKKMVAHLPVDDDLHLLDLATGTCDQLLLMMKSGRIKSALGIDLAEEMLALGKEKIKDYDNVELKCASALEVPVEEGSFDVVTMSFGIRNAHPTLSCLQEMVRVLRKGGRALILEFSLPKNGLIKWGHLFYLRKILPKVGGLISGKREAYSYLNKTIESFPYGDEFKALMNEAGFSKVDFFPMTFGVATLYVGEKDV